LGHDTGVSIGFSLLIECRGDLVECALYISSERSAEMRGRMSQTGDEGREEVRGESEVRKKEEIERDIRKQ